MIGLQPTRHVVDYVVVMIKVVTTFHTVATQVYLTAFWEVLNGLKLTSHVVHQVVYTIEVVTT